MPSFREAVGSFLTPAERKHMVYSFDVLGDMALIEIPRELAKKSSRIARKLLDTSPSLKRVYEKVGVHSGKYRVEKTKWLAGVKNPVVVYTEWGCTFVVHPGKVFFNPRLSTERQRVSSYVKKGQSVCVFFSGVGPYTVALAKHTALSRVYGIEWNPEAKKYAEENIVLNKVIGRVVPIWGDVDAVPVLEECAHVVMPAPETASSHLGAAVNWCKVKGLIHFYTFVSSANVPVQLKKILHSHMPEGVKWKIAFSRRVSDFSPSKQQWCVGIQVLSKPKVGFKKSKKKNSA
jgi:tRNA (guanine37-N1)-methyltransferase